MSRLTEVHVGLLRHRMGLALLLRGFFRLATGWSFVWGSVILVARLGFGMPASQLACGLAGYFAALLVAALQARRQIPSRAQLVALLDRESGARGLLMAGDTVPLGPWEQTLRASAPPRVVWRDRRAVALALVSIAYAGASFAVPRGSASLFPSRRLDVGRDVADIRALVEDLAGQGILDDTRAEEIEQALEKAAETAESGDPAATWEALDHARQSLDHSATEAAAQAAAQADALATVESVASALNDRLGSGPEGDGSGSSGPAGSAGDDNPRAKEALQELAGLIDASTLPPDALASLDPALRAALENRTLTAEQLEQLARCLRECKDRQCGRLDRLQALSSVDAKALEACRSGLEQNDEALAAFLCDQEGSALAETLCAANRPGRGGVSRGRGDAPMTWKDGTDESGATFKEEALPPGAVTTLQGSELLGTTRSAPEFGPDGRTLSAGGALPAGAAGGGAAVHQAVLPRHRETVRAYFERGQKP